MDGAHQCHHVGAVSFDAILRHSRARYMPGLTATPFRRDGQQPIIFMQFGPIRHTAATPVGAPTTLDVTANLLEYAIGTATDAPIQEVFRALAQNAQRTATIAAEIERAYREGRKVLVLTERTDHLDAILAALGDSVPNPFVLHGRLSRRQRTRMLGQLDALPPNAPRVLLATGKLVGEGFDHPPLDTLVLAMPVSWKGTLQQYAGRLHREHAGKSDVRIIDVVDTGHPALLRMWEKRQRGYHAMGYRVTDRTVRPEREEPHVWARSSDSAAKRGYSVVGTP
jgi:superfamily II DNA or RNA helicase